VLLLDEVVEVVACDRENDWTLFKALWSFSNIRKAQLVLSGELTLMESLEDPDSPLYNHAIQLRLGPLEPAAVEELVTRPMEWRAISLDDRAAIVGRIHEFTSGHPNVVQRLCHRLIQRHEPGTPWLITLRDVDAVAADPTFQKEDFLQTYWERATPLERVICLLMAQGQTPCRLKGIIQQLADHDLHPDAAAVEAALERLVSLRLILRRSQQGFEFAVTAFPRVLEQAISTEDLLHVYASQIKT